MTRLLPLALCFLFFLAGTDGRVTSGNILLTGENSVGLLTKFALSPNQSGTFNLDLKIPTAKGMYTDERFLKVSLFNEEKGAWAKAKHIPLCADKIRHSHLSRPIVFNSSTIKGETFWVANVNVNIPKSKRSMYWYFTLNDCILEQSYHSITDVPEMEYKIVVRNGQSHVSADEEGMAKLHLFQIISSSALLLWVLFKVIKAAGSKSGQVHIALISVACAILCDIFSCASEMIHSSVYTSNGVGSYTFDCLASHFEAQCDAIVALVLLTVGAGWTLPSDALITGKQNIAMMGTHSWVQKTVSGFRSPIAAIGQLKDGNPAAILVLLILTLHAALAQWGRTFNDEFDSYHSLEHKPGRVLMWFRVGLGVVFLAASASVRNNGRCPRSLQPFLKKFQLVGVSWFVSLPFVATYVSSTMHSHQKHFALHLGSLVVQSSSLASLVWLFTGDKDASAYHRMNNLQPGNDTLSSAPLPSAGGTSFSNIWKIGKTKVRLD
jgi:hypothetical protein